MVKKMFSKRWGRGFRKKYKWGDWPYHSVLPTLFAGGGLKIF